MMLVAIEMGSCATHLTANAYTLAGIHRNGWPESIGIPGRIRSEQVAGFNRNA